MMGHEAPGEETQRLAALESYEVLDTPSEVIFDELARMAASICETPIALVSLIDGNRQWFKARHGIDATETPREIAFCAHAIRNVEPLIVPDAREDDRFAANPLVTDGPLIRFYAGAPLITSEGEALGTLCVIDQRPRELAPEKIEALSILGRHVVAQLELRRRIKELSQTHVRRTREMRGVVAEQKLQIEQLTLDPQTGLPNRESFLRRIDERLTDPVASKRAITAFVIELQRFDLLVEAMGASAVDSLVKDIAARMSTCASDLSDVAHLREERFGLLRVDLHGATAAALFAESELLPVLNAPYHVGGLEFRPTFKVGIAVTPADGQDGVSALRAAKTALVTAKSNQQSIAFSSPEVAARVAGALTLETKLRRAIERNQFVLHYQPKVNLASGEITGLEALLRWADPDARVRDADGSPALVPPGRFVPLREETGLIVPVGRMVLAQAADDYRDWVRRGFAVPRIAVNVSTLQLLQKDFLESVRQLLAQGPTPQLDIEITEATFLEHTQQSVDCLIALREQGMQVAIDDFGTGYSSLRYLTDLPIDVLKIDRTFVGAMMNRPKDLAVVTSIISLARGLGFKTVAEGVETIEQRSFLQALQCDEMQGYLFSRPLSKGDLEVQLLKHEPGPAADRH